MKKSYKKVWFLTISIALFAIVGGIIMFADFAKVVDSQGKGIAAMDGMFVYNPSAIYDTFFAMGDRGRLSYTIFHILDYFFLLSYCLLMISLTLMFVPKNKKLLAIVPPVVTAIFDLAENTLLEILSFLYPTEYPFLAKVTAVITPLKWASGVVWFGIFIVIVAMFVTEKIKSKKLEDKG